MITWVRHSEIETGAEKSGNLLYKPIFCWINVRYVSTSRTVLLVLLNNQQHGLPAEANDFDLQTRLLGRHPVTLNNLTCCRFSRRSRSADPADDKKDLLLIGLHSRFSHMELTALKLCASIFVCFVFFSGFFPFFCFVVFSSKGCFHQYYLSTDLKNSLNRKALFTVFILYENFTIE